MRYISASGFRCFFMFLVLVGTRSVEAQTVPAGRRTIPINEGWQFKKADSRRDVAITEKKWKQVNVPHTWNSKDIQSGNGFYAGEASYKKEIFADSSWKNKRVFIRFEGVGQVAQVYINDKLIGKHKGSYAAFAFDLSYALDYGKKNTLIVKVSNQESGDVIPINNALFPIYGGIYRPVSLIITDKVNIAVTDYASPGIYIRQKNVSAKSADIEVTAKIENKSTAFQSLQLATSIYDVTGKLVKQSIQPIRVSTQGMQLFTQHIVIDNPHLWNGKKDAYLYKVVTAVKDGDTVRDEVIQPLGVRKFEIKTGKGFYLNDEPYRLYGVCRHQDMLDCGNALPNEQHAADLEDIKEIGATSIRFAHYQQAEYLYSKCDSMGFVIWAEIPFVNDVSGNEADNAKQQLTELIRQNFNHPSIYVWGLHNEVYCDTPGDYTAVLTQQLNDLAKTEDPDRYTVSVSGYGEMNRPANLNADIQGMNRYYGWYEGRIGDIAQWVEGLEKKYPDYKVMLSEYGVEANINQHDETASSRDKGNAGGQFWPEEYQTKFHEIQWGVLEKHPYLTASYVWNMFDFAVPPANGGGVPARNMKGLITYDRKIKKDAFYWYKANWNPEPMVYITGRRLTQRTQLKTSIAVYSNLDKTTLYVNGKKLTGYKQGTTKVHCIFEDVSLQKGQNILKATGSRDGKTFEDTITFEVSDAASK
ncbi:sugar-binding domain-containing protein [Chitinophagaceae bacterium LWZ2-11]